MGATLGIVFGLVLVGLGAAMVSNHHSWGTQIVEKTVPKSLRVGDAESYRKVLGYSYLGAGLVFMVVSIIVLAR